MVVQIGSLWFMYATGVKDGCGCISVLTSDNLVDWQFAGYALTSTDEAPMNPPWGAFESPFVLEYEGMFYLFTTHTNCSRASYHNTLVFCSSDPLRFGEYTGANHDELVVATLPVHAGEIVADGDRNYITTCGWNNCGVSIEGGVAIADLRFE